MSSTPKRRKRRALPLLVVLTAGLLGPGAVAAGERPVLISDFPVLQQQHLLSCEYAAAHAVTRFWGHPITEREFIREVPSSPNPHLGFRGLIDGPGGGLSDYGVYAEPLVPVVERRGFRATVFYGGVERLKANLRAGNPVIVWLTVGPDKPRQVSTHTHRGASFKLVPGEHAVVARGYDRDGVYLMDVGKGKFAHAAWDSFLRRWGYFDQMALVIRPAGAGAR